MALARAQSAESTRLEALRSRHAAISREIEDSMKHLAVSDLDIRRMKSERLLLKDEMEEIRQTS
jgi:hypothetical protein